MLFSSLNTLVTSPPKLFLSVRTVAKFTKNKKNKNKKINYRAKFRTFGKRVWNELLNVPRAHLRKSKKIIYRLTLIYRLTVLKI